MDDLYEPPPLDAQQERSDQQGKIAAAALFFGPLIAGVLIWLVSVSGPSGSLALVLLIGAVVFLVSRARRT